VLEPLELAGGHEHLGVQREAVVVGAQRSRQRRRARRAALGKARLTVTLPAETRQAILVP
jgi:hypothetical protein